MIKYALRCVDSNDSFEGWFRNSQDYQEQLAKNLISCPVCGSVNIEKQIMSPNISISEKRIKIREQIARIKDYIDKNFEDVGDNFANEVIAIHKGISEDRAIQGKITRKEAEKLKEMNLPFMILPNTKEDA